MTDERAQRGARIRELREGKGLSRPQLAEALGLSPASGQVKQWETGGRPNADNLAALARYFGVTEEYILGLAPSEATPGVLFLSRRDRAVSEAFTMLSDRLNELREAQDDRAQAVVSALESLQEVVGSMNEELANLRATVEGQLPAQGARGSQGRT